jgi:hypothetical protein
MGKGERRGVSLPAPARRTGRQSGLTAWQGSGYYKRSLASQRLARLPEWSRRGIEPLTSFPQSESVQQDATKAAPHLAHSLARETQIDPDLARVLDAWPTLPEHIKAAVLALLNAAPPSLAPDSRPGGAVK